MSSDNLHDDTNHGIFRDCLFNAILERSTAGRKDKSKKSRNHKVKKAPVASTDNAADQKSSDTSSDPSELVDFSDYLANEIFPSLPDELRSISYQALQDDSDLSEKWSLPLSLSTYEDVVEHIPGSVNDSLETYGLIEPPKTDLQTFISPIIAVYLSAATVAPPRWTATKTDECEICERDHVPLTYHHLIPRAVHDKVLKRGWHDEHTLNSVAWLCRACHSYVHRIASNEELAKEWYTIERLCSREDVQKFALWMGTVRWKKH